MRIEIRPLCSSSKSFSSGTTEASASSLLSLCFLGASCGKGSSFLSFSSSIPTTGLSYYSCVAALALSMSCNAVEDTVSYFGLLFTGGISIL